MCRQQPRLKLLYLTLLLCLRSSRAYTVSLTNFHLDAPPPSFIRTLFSSVPRRHVLLEGINLMIEGGEVLPLVGNSGSGKTLLAEAFYRGLGGANRADNNLFGDVAIRVSPTTPVTPVWIDRFTLDLSTRASSTSVSSLYMDRITYLCSSASSSKSTPLFLCLDEAVEIESREVRLAVKKGVEELCRKNDWAALWITHKREDNDGNGRVMMMIGGRLNMITQNDRWITLK